MTKKRLALLLTLVSAVPVACGQPVSEEEPKAQLRVLAFPSGNASGEVAVKALAKGMEASVVLASVAAGRNHISEGYDEFPAGEGTYGLLSGDKPLGSGALNLKPKCAYSLVAWQGADGKWQSKLFADDTTPVTRTMRVLNFLPNRPAVVSTDQSEGATIAPATVQELMVPAKEVVIRASVENPEGGPPFQTSTGFDFTQAGSGYLLVGLDYRGKPDIRVVAGGFVAAAPAEPLSATPLVPPTASALQKQAEENRKESIAYLKSALADLEAMQGGANKIPNADAIRQDLQKQLQALEKPTAPPKPAAVPPGTTTGPPR